MTVGESWLELELRLLLVGCEERYRPGLRAARDRARPLVWDRHLAVASALPADLEREMGLLDSWYREGEAMRFSVVAADGEPATAWARELEPFAMTPSTIAFLEGMAEAPDPGAVPMLRLPGPTAGLELLTRFRRLLVRERGEDPGPLPAQLSGALALRSFLGWTPRVLALNQGEETASVIVYSYSGERGWMEDLETREGFRGRGHARTLLRAASAELARLGVRRIGFSARVEDWPHEWYQREGFRVVERAVRFERIL